MHLFLKRNKRLIIACLFLTGGLNSLRADPEVGFQESETSIKRSIDSLDLSEEQKKEVLAILKDVAARRKVILDESGLTPDLTKREKFKILRKIKPKFDSLDEETDRRLSDVLSSAEMETFKQVRADLKKQLRVKLKERKSLKS